MNLTWKRTLRTPSSERFLAIRDGKDLAAVDLHYLTNGTIAGAGLDVFDQEPPPPNNPLFGLKNVILTAHFAGPTWDNQFTRFRNGFDNCQRVIRGEKPLWIIPELRG